MLLSALQTGLVDRLLTVDGLTVSKWETPVIEPPHAVVRPASVTYNATMGRGSDDVEFSILVITSRADTETGLDELHEFAAGHGDRSIRAALETSLGASDQINDCMIRVDAAEIGATDVGDASYLTATFAVFTTIDGA